MEQVLQGANAARGTATLRLRQTALATMTSHDDYLSLLDTQEREHLKQFERKLNQAQTTLNWLEERPFENHIEDTTFLNYGELIPHPAADGVMTRNLIIQASMDELCTDQTFAKPFYLWERTATFQSLRARQIRTWLSDM